MSDEGGERTEFLVSEKNLVLDGGSVVPSVPLPDPEVPEQLEQPRRRHFTVGYKLRILSEADAARTTGEIGALLRRKGLYSSHLAAWRRQREQGILQALAPQRRGRPSSSPNQRELARLRQENGRLSQKLAAAEAVIAIPKNVSRLLGLVEPSSPSSERPCWPAWPSWFPASAWREPVGAWDSRGRATIASAEVGRMKRARRQLSPHHRCRRRRGTTPRRIRSRRRSPRRHGPTRAPSASPSGRRFSRYSTLRAFGMLRPRQSRQSPRRTWMRAPISPLARRNQLAHPVSTKPELLATVPNQVRSWDITKLLGPAKWTYFWTSFSTSSAAT